MVDVDETGSFKTFVRSSNIIEVTSLDEDKKAKIMDDFIESINFTKETRIINRKILVFNSYAEASDDKFTTKSQF